MSDIMRLDQHRRRRSLAKFKCVLQQRTWRRSKHGNKAYARRCVDKFSYRENTAENATRSAHVLQTHGNLTLCVWAIVTGRRAIGQAWSLAMLSFTSPTTVREQPRTQRCIIHQCTLTTTLTQNTTKHVNSVHIWISIATVCFLFRVSVDALC